MKTIAVIISSQLYVRNYIESGVLDKLAQFNSVNFIVEKEITMPDAFSGHVFRYERNDQHDLRKRFIFDIFMYKYRKKSTSFEFRMNYYYAIFQPQEWHGISTIKGAAINIFRMWKRLKQGSVLKALSWLPRSVILRFFDGNAVNESLKLAVQKANPDVVLIPSSAYASEDVELAFICRALSIKSCLLVDNWDNLSSKSILWEKTDYVGVWGEQTKDHAIKIQGFLSRQVYLIGSARFSEYFEKRGGELNSYFKMPYVLFVGTARPFNEVAVLEILEEELERNQDIYGSLKIIYRPHPWRQGSDLFEPGSFKHVLLDPQLAEPYLARKHGSDIQPTLGYYPSLISNAVFVVGGTTSMAIESQIFYKRYIALVHDEKYSSSSPAKIFREYIHLHGLEKLEAVQLCRDLKDLPDHFRAIFCSPAIDDKSSIDEHREYFVFNDGADFGDRICRLVEDICEEARVI